MEALQKDGVNTGAERIIIAHLGNGASMAAIRNGHPVETSMGFSTIAGLPMGTRCGDLDPGILLYLMREEGMTADEMSDLLYNQSGLLGISGLSRNMQDLLDSREDAANEAVDYFCYQARLHLARLTGALGGLVQAAVDVDQHRR
jgi:acetate kinase